jgi:hypothetical protein
VSGYIQPFEKDAKDEGWGSRWLAGVPVPRDRPLMR